VANEFPRDEEEVVARAAAHLRKCESEWWRCGFEEPERAALMEEEAINWAVKSVYGGWRKG
jgi:hypothetical protein